METGKSPITRILPQAMAPQLDPCSAHPGVPTPRNDHSCGIALPPPHANELDLGHRPLPEGLSAKDIPHVFKQCKKSS